MFLIFHPFLHRKFDTNPELASNNKRLTFNLLEFEKKKQNIFILFLGARKYIVLIMCQSSTEFYT